MSLTVSTPLGIFDDHWKYCHACNAIRNGVYQIEKFTFKMIVPKEPIHYGVGPTVIQEPRKPDWRGIF